MHCSIKSNYYTHLTLISCSLLLNILTLTFMFRPSMSVHSSRLGLRYVNSNSDIAVNLNKLFS